jgi:hypothetical protein
MVPTLQEVDPAIGYQIDNSVLLRKPPRPRSTREKFQRLGFPDPGKWIASDRIHEVERAKSNLSIGFDPESQIFQEFRLKHQNPFLFGRAGARFTLFLCQAQAPHEVRQSKTGGFLASRLARALSRDVPRFLATSADAPFRGDSTVHRPKQEPRPLRSGAG